MIIMTYSNDQGFISERCVISRNETLNAHNSPFNYVNSYSQPFNYFNPNVVTIEKTITPSTLLPTSPRGSRWNEIFSHRPAKHRCTRVQNPGEGVAQIFAWVSRLSGHRKFPYFGFYCIFISKFFENLPGGSLLYPPSPIIYATTVYYVRLTHVKLFGIIHFVENHFIKNH